MEYIVGYKKAGFCKMGYNINDSDFQRLLLHLKETGKLEENPASVKLQKVWEFFTTSGRNVILTASLFATVKEQSAYLSFRNESPTRESCEPN